mgnify:CR=1 FL=1
MESNELCLDGCKTRQERLAKELVAQGLSAAIFSSHANVQYFTAFRPHWLVNSLLIIDDTGHSTLVAPNRIPDRVAAHEVLTYSAQWHSTLRQDQLSDASNALRDSIGSVSGRIGCESELPGSVIGLLNVNELSRVVDINPTMWKLRRRKDEDELAMIRRSIACTHAMYETAKEILEPGINELEMYSQLHRTAIRVAGEPLTAFGNDYQCNSRGGPPRDRVTEAGELYILDLGPCCSGYWADNCRTFAVDGRPSDSQQAAWEAIVSALRHVEQTVRPGKSCYELFNEVQAMLDEYQEGAFCHHLGHGFGLFPHETPHLNPNWEDSFEIGDVFTAEPGLYTEELRSGIRLEQNYLVTADGVERLTSFPLEL